MENLLLATLVNTASIGATTNETWYWTQPAPGEWRLEAAYIVSWTTLAAHATDYTTIALKQGATTLGSLSSASSGGAAFTAGTARAFTLSGGTALEFGQGDVLTATKTDAGGGGALDFTVTGYFKRLG
jgi:hypothetical protein